MQKIISFSLWGDSAKYGVGAILNAQLAKKYFPEWKCVFYYDSSVPKIYISALNDFDNVETIEVTDGTYGAFWRLFQIQPNTITLVRDTDSRLSEREKNIVDDWLTTDRKVCIIRDHIRHYDFPILTGMFGIKGGFPESAYEDMKSHWKIFSYASEQVWLGNTIFRLIPEECKIYGLKETVWMRESYPSIGKHFIGQSYDDNNYPVYEATLA